MIVIGIDPSPVGYHCVYIGFEKEPPVYYFFDAHRMSQEVSSINTLPGLEDVTMYCEMVASYGMPVGRSVFDTVLNIGRLLNMFPNVNLITRGMAKLELCHNPRAKDKNVKQALIDIYGEVGLKKTPGPMRPFHGTGSDSWAALAVAHYGWLRESGREDLSLYEVGVK